MLRGIVLLIIAAREGTPCFLLPKNSFHMKAHYDSNLAVKLPTG